MRALTFANVKLNDQLPSLTMPPLTRHTLAIYCGASGDHNPIHVDIDFAQSSGLDDVIAHGMLIMAYLGRLLTNSVRPSAIRSFDTRFQAMTKVGDSITASARVVEKYCDGDDRCIRVELAAVDQSGEVKATGTAVLALP